MNVAPAVSIVLPTYNEKDNVPVIVDLIAQVLAPHCSFEVLVVDDNSPDGTWRLAEQLSESRPWLRTIRRMHNRGLSPAVVDGFSVAKGQRLIVMDADMQHDEQALIGILAAFDEGAQLVVGSRKAAGGGVENWSVVRRLASWLATRFATLVLPVQVSDPMSGFFGITQGVHEAVTPQINPKGFKILLEYLARLPAEQVTEIGYTFRGRLHGESKMSHDVILDYLEALWGLSQASSWVSWRFLNYAIVGCVGLLVNMGTLWVLTRAATTSPSVSLMIAVELSIVSNFYLNNMLTFRNQRFRGVLKVLRGLVMFNAICATGAVINHALALKLTQSGLANIYFATMIGYAVATMWNYIVNTHVCWGASKK